MIMDAEEFLEWIFEAPDDVLTPEEFRNWKMQQEAEEILKEIEADPELQNLEFSKKDSERIYQNILRAMEKS
jgi:putative SOS response-associated peptidase YedK